MTDKKKIILLGNPVEHSVSPEMHNYAFKKTGLDYCYSALKTQDLKQAIKRLKEDGFAGANITIPYKTKIIAYLDLVEEKAAKIGAVNTITNNKGILKGYNTDVDGFITPLQDITSIKGKDITLIGSGGAAKAIAYSIKENGGHLRILNRTEAHSKELAEKIGCRYGGLQMLEGLKTDILINSTPIGMFPETEKSIMPNFHLKNIIVYDIIYNPLETKLIKEAKNSGCRVLNGLDMFVKQGAISFELWTGEKAPIKDMKNFVENTIRRNKE